MAFPEIEVVEVKSTFLGFDMGTNKEERTVGWEDLGKIEPVLRFVEGRNLMERLLCPVCFSELKLGREKSKTFRYCPRCMHKCS